MRVRGLKPNFLVRLILRLAVAPHAGAWIETFLALNLVITRVVAPHAGAWIETSKLGGVRQPLQVAPYVGAWIETDLTNALCVSKTSHPMWVRGLKPLCEPPLLSD